MSFIRFRPLYLEIRSLSTPLHTRKNTAVATSVQKRFRIAHLPGRICKTRQPVNQSQNSLFHYVQINGNRVNPQGDLFSELLGTR